MDLLRKHFFCRPLAWGKRSVAPDGIGDVERRLAGADTLDAGGDLVGGRARVVLKIGDDVAELRERNLDGVEFVVSVAAIGRIAVPDGNRDPPAGSCLRKPTRAVRSSAS